MWSLPVTSDPLLLAPPLHILCWWFHGWLAILSKVCSDRPFRIFQYRFGHYFLSGKPKQYSAEVDP